MTPARRRAFPPEVRRFAIIVDPAGPTRVADAGGLPVLRLADPDRPRPASAMEPDGGRNMNSPTKSLRWRSTTPRGPR